MQKRESKYCRGRPQVTGAMGKPDVMFGRRSLSVSSQPCLSHFESSVTQVKNMINKAKQTLKYASEIFQSMQCMDDK